MKDQKGSLETTLKIVLAGYFEQDLINYSMKRFTETANNYFRDLKWLVLSLFLMVAMLLFGDREMLIVSIAGTAIMTFWLAFREVTPPPLEIEKIEEIFQYSKGRMKEGMISVFPEDDEKEQEVLQAILTWIDSRKIEDVRHDNSIF